VIVLVDASSSMTRIQVQEDNYEMEKEALNAGYSPARISAITVGIYQFQPS